MSDELPKLRIRKHEYPEENDTFSESDRALIYKIYKLVKDDISLIKGFVLIVTLISLSSMIMLIVLMTKISEYGC